VVRRIVNFGRNDCSDQNQISAMVRLRDQKRRHCFAGRIGFRASIGHKPVSREASGSQSSLTSATLPVNMPSMHPCDSSTAAAAQAFAPPWRSRMWHRLTQRSSHSRLSCEVAPHGVSRVAALCRLHYSSLPCPRATVLTMSSSLDLRWNAVPWLTTSSKTFHWLCQGPRTRMSCDEGTSSRSRSMKNWPTHETVLGCLGLYFNIGCTLHGCTS